MGGGRNGRPVRYQGIRKGRPCKPAGVGKARVIGGNEGAADTGAAPRHGHYATRDSPPRPRSPSVL